jgi:hypothetical protein
MTHHSVTGKTSSCALEGEVKRAKPKGFNFIRSSKGRTLFAFTLPLLLLMGGKWLANIPAGNLLKDITALATRLNLPGKASLEKAFNLPITFQVSNQYSLAILPAENSTIERYGWLELNLQTNIPVVNPYDPKELELKVRFTAPSGNKLDVGAFWYQDFNPQTRQAKGEPGWRVRFSPDEPGEWSAVAYAASEGAISELISFKVNPSNRVGFIRTNPKDPHYLAFDNGDFFFPIGVNMAWWGDLGDPLEQYQQWLDQFSANGGNTIRIWMAAWSFGIEWKDTGLGNYDNRQYEAWLLDQLFSMAGEHKVKIILVLMNHGPFSLVANSEWEDNPYNSELGGPLTSPEQFVSDATARAYYQQRLSYIINRWGYSTDLLAWEWWNEVDLTPIAERALIPWLHEMTVFLKQRDVNHHLTTNSFSVRSWSPIWKMPELDIIQVHEYSEYYPPAERDPADRVGQQLRALTQSLPAKPILLGEFGYSGRDYGEDVEKTGIHLHNGLWATTFSGYGGSGMYWWWDIYIDANHLWSQFNGLVQFINGVDLTQYEPFSPLQITGQAAITGSATGLGLRGKDTLVWLRSKDYTVDASIAAREAQQNPTNYIPPLMQGLFLTLNDMADGKYTVYWYDPQTADWLPKAEVSTIGKDLTIPIPAFRTDLAAKIVRNP